MKKTSALIVSELLTLEDFARLTHEFGCVYDHSGLVHECRISIGQNFIWIFKDDSMLAIYEETESAAAIKQKLGNRQIGSVFILETSSNSNHSEMLIPIIRKLVQSTPCVWEWEDEKFLSNQELRSKLFELYATVTAAKELSSLVPKNTIGSVVMCFDPLNYEVEFVDQQGETLEILTVNSADLLTYKS